MTTSHAYIAACEIQSPNSPDFEAVLAHQRRLHATRFLQRVREFAFTALNRGEIEDEDYLVFIDIINQITPE